MTQSEKANRYDAIVDIRQRFKGMFDGAGKFATHELDKGRAENILKFAISEKITFQEFKEITLGYFDTSGLTNAMLKIEKDKVLNYFGKKLK